MKRMRVWRQEDFANCSDDDERIDLAWEVPRTGYPITDARKAAELYADHCHSQRDGWEWIWPIQFVVHDGENYWLVDVERYTVPEFESGRPKPLVVP